MKDLLRVSLVGLISGITGTGIGGLMAFFVKNISNRTLSSIMEFSAGLMTAVVCFKLIPEAFELGNIATVILSVLIGVFVIILLEDIIINAEFLKKKKSKQNSGLLRVGVLTAIGIALHNFPEGFAVGSGFEASISLGVTLTLVILIHDIPEGIAMAVPLKTGGFSGMKSFILTILSGVPMGLGAFIGAALGGISKQFIAMCLGFAGGAMLYITCSELIPESQDLYRGKVSSLSLIMGLIAGIIISRMVLS